ncbi:MAG: hypothetical protein EB824_01750 [Thaumarchaeota archaeon S15]|nr:MAG: hypothetical protein EB832_04095 [Thaumarchaeota archaeon S14]RNJ73581.1 MAG: hypothetical protein EB833_02485 [Thaumarchaeota archaeon S13]RNJ75391.1 MAG: hypothetical protein EB824_01750 [Thaumarchaeota archaeon S15]
MAARVRAGKSPHASPAQVPLDAPLGSRAAGSLVDPRSSLPVAASAARLASVALEATQDLAKAICSGHMRICPQAYRALG